MQERTDGEAANRLRLSLVSVTQQAVDIVAVELAKAHHSPLAPFTAGARSMVICARACHGKPRCATRRLKITPMS
jgi:hypothetical protein